MASSRERMASCRSKAMRPLQRVPYPPRGYSSPRANHAATASVDSATARREDAYFTFTTSPTAARPVTAASFARWNVALPCLVRSAPETSCSQRNMSAGGLIGRSAPKAGLQDGLGWGSRAGLATGWGQSQDRLGMARAPTTVLAWPIDCPSCWKSPTHRCKSSIS